MPLVDLPLEKLRTYEGRNPRPADFDSYWERALAGRETSSVRLEEVDLGVPSVRAAEVWTDEDRLFAKWIVPKWTQGPFPVVVFFHGYAWRSPDWFTLLSWAAAGFAVLAPDVRGQGGRSSERETVRGNTLRGHIVRGLDDHPDRLFYRQAFLDTLTWVEVAAAMPNIDRTRIMAHGASQGGGLALACAALAGDQVSKVAAIYPFLCDYRRVWEMDLAKDAYEELRLFFRIQDPLHERESEVFEKLGYVDVQHLAPRISAETLLITGLMDTICPPSTQFAVYNKVKAKKEVLIYPDFGHDGLPGVNERVLAFFQS